MQLYVSWVDTEERMTAKEGCEGYITFINYLTNTSAVDLVHIISALGAALYLTGSVAYVIPEPSIVLLDFAASTFILGGICFVCCSILPWLQTNEPSSGSVRKQGEDVEEAPSLSFYAEAA